MTSEHRITSGFIADALGALDRHGYVRGDDLHAGRAIGLIGDLARIWEGTQDHPAGAHLITVPPSLPVSGQAEQDAVILSRADVSAVFAVLDIAADYKRCRAQMCAGCADQSCPACQGRLQAARAYDQMAGRAAADRRSRPRRQGQPARARSSVPARI